MKPIHAKEENTMQPPKEMKGPSCIHAPAEWAECARCIENYYLERLTVERRLRVQARRRLVDTANALRTVDTLLQEPTEAETARQRVLEDYSAEDCASGVLASLKRGRERPIDGATPRASFAALRALVEIWGVDDPAYPPAMYSGRGKVFSVLKGAPPIHGATPDEVLEKVLIATLDELETQKAALEARAGLLESELEQAKKSLLAATAQTEELGLLAQGLEQQKDTAYAERNELAALVVQMACALGLGAGWRLDESAEEGRKMLLMVQLPTGQVSWRLPSRDQALTEDLPTTSAPWDGHDKAEARRRIRRAIATTPRALAACGGAYAQRGALPAPAPTQEPRSWRQGLLQTALKRVDDAPCWCEIDWRGLRPSNHSALCERLYALLREMIKEEEKTP